MEVLMLDLRELFFAAWFLAGVYGWHKVILRYYGSHKLFWRDVWDGKVEGWAPALSVMAGPLTIFLASATWERLAKKLETKCEEFWLE
jgi:hypothetical protein